MTIQPLDPLAPANWPSKLSDIVADMNGEPLNVHRLMANNSQLMQAWWSFRNHSVNGGSLGQEKVELLILRVAVHMCCWYEWGAHVDRALQVGISPQCINDLLDPNVPGRWPIEDVALICAVDELTMKHAISSPMLAKLQRYFTNEQVMDLIAIHGMYVILAGMVNTWGLPLDDMIFERIKPYSNEDTFLLAAERFSIDLPDLN